MIQVIYSTSKVVMRENLMRLVNNENQTINGNCARKTKRSRQLQNIKDKKR